MGHEGDGMTNAERKKAMAEVLRNRIKPMLFTPAQVERGKIGRNEPCGCGSGKKFKRCCKR
jgi:uncharacterized protein YecA (UPF0149 family)